MKAVGIGCFWFAEPRDVSRVDSQLAPKDFIQNIKGALEGVDNVSDVKIYGEGSVTHLWVGEDDDDEYDDNNYFPLFTDLWISFDIFLPERLREEYGLDWGNDRVDFYHVDIFYDFDMPVTFIHYDMNDATNFKKRNPAHTVALIRNYLEDKLKAHGNVVFQFLGPSPFHADIFLKRGNAKNSATVKDITENAEGYRTLYFELPAKNEETLILEFANAYKRILSAYYQVVRFRNRSIHLASKIIGRTRDLISSRRRRFAFLEWFRRRAIIDEIYGAILDEKLNRVSMDEFVANLKQC